MPISSSDGRVYLNSVYLEPVYLKHSYQLASSQQNNYSSLDTPSTLYQSNIDKAQALLSEFQAGNEQALKTFEERHPKGKDKDFSPTLLDARLLVSRDRFHQQNLNLEQLKKNAKQLLKWLKKGTDDATQRLNRHHPKAKTLIESIELSYKLADAQLIIARENGLGSWPRLKRHLEQLSLAEAQIESKKSLDGDLRTLHIRCGTDIREALPAAGFKGDFKPVINPFPQGPVPPSEPVEVFAKARSNFVDNAYGDSNDPEAVDDSVKLFVEEEQLLRTLPAQYERICLWFEHDCFDQLCFAYLLHHLAKLNLSGVKLELIQVNQFPGIRRFIGIGQLSQKPASLALLWQHRQSITPKMMSFGASVWQAFTEQTPSHWLQLANEHASPLPIMQDAMHRLLCELPAQENGLSLTQNLSLKILARDGALKPAQIFQFLMAEEEPQAYLGDIMFLHNLRELGQSDRPAVSFEFIEPHDHPLLREKVSITEAGRALLAGRLNWMDLNPDPRWLGGTVFQSGQKNSFWAKGKVLVQ